MVMTTTRALEARVVPDGDSLTLDGTFGQVWNACAQRARTAIPVNFTATHDSLGVPWVGRMRATIEGDVTLQDLRKLGKERDQADTFFRGDTLYAVNPGSDLAVAGGPGIRMTQNGIELWDLGGLRSVHLDATTGDVAVSGNATIDGFVSVGGDVDIGGTVAIHGVPSLLIDGTTTMNGSLTINASLTVAGLITANALNINTVNTEHLVDRAVQEAKQANDSVSSRTIVPLAVATGKLADLAVLEGKIGNFSVTGGKVASRAINNGKLEDNATDARVLAGSTIETYHLTGGLAVSGTITTGTGLTLGGLNASDLHFPNGVRFGNIGGVQSLSFNIGGTASFSGSGTHVGGWTQASTRASKTAWAPITLDDAKRALELEPGTFRYRVDWLNERTKQVIEPHDYQDRETGQTRRTRRRVIACPPDKRRHAGLIAEDVAAAGLEELISRDEAGAPDGVDYGKLTPYLLTLVKDLYARLDDQAATIAALGDRLARLEAA